MPIISPVLLVVVLLLAIAGHVRRTRLAAASSPSSGATG